MNNISDTDLWIWNEDYFEQEVNIPNKGLYLYSFSGEMPVKCEKGEKIYELLYLDHFWTCSCPGYGYRRKCSHMENIPNEIWERIEKEVEEVKHRSGDGPLVRAAKNALAKEWNRKTQKMEPVLDDNGNPVSAYDKFWR